MSDEANDAVTRDLLKSIVKAENGHVDWLEEQLDQITQLAVPMYLSTKTRAQLLREVFLDGTSPRLCGRAVPTNGERGKQTVRLSFVVRSIE